MSFLSILLRLCLCATLVANGIGVAQASVRMQLAHASHTSFAAGHSPLAAPVAPLAAVDLGEECHPGMSEPSQVAVAPSDVDGPPDEHGHHGSAQAADVMDCCDGASCQCACVQHASAAFIGVVANSALPVDAAAALSGTSQHASPRLPHLIRPPIG